MIPKPTITVCILYYKYNALKVSVNKNPQSIPTTFPINTMGLRTCILPGLSCFQLARGGAVWHITVIPCAFVICLICTPSALTGPRASGVPIRQTTHAHGITITCMYIYVSAYFIYNTRQMHTASWGEPENPCTRDKRKRFGYAIFAFRILRTRNLCDHVRSIRRDVVSYGG